MSMRLCHGKDESPILMTGHDPCRPSWEIEVNINKVPEGEKEDSRPVYAYATNQKEADAGSNVCGSLHLFTLMLPSLRNHAQCQRK
ncbi:hypothetical protein LMH87_010410 [Akanthomyces muscarius]|uniref:Uncharacterized protein n=1 Tax=Akanthomyces muscarius TaxID=2231603 RepID=A0A9W8QE62_AKAMU|nr:hypothetical protein LMH87_010410 [Akanthomyces muscarius]KAJ4153945.1 hypothetical protein LMH87_010410 [Akanthomyces muscarius]